MNRKLIACLAVGSLLLFHTLDAAKPRARKPRLEPPPSARFVFRDDFETYRNSARVWAVRGNPFDTWRRDPGPKGWIDWLTGGPCHGGQASMGLEFAGTGRHSRQAVLYYRIPLERVQQLRRMGFEGWISSEMMEQNRLLLQLQRWTGGPAGVLTIAGIQYDGRSGKWQCQSGGAFAPFSEPVQYPSDRNLFHYFELVVDWSGPRYVSFRFDDTTWDLTRFPTLPVRPQSVHRRLQPMLELDVRLLSGGVPFCSRAFVDELAIGSKD